MVFPKTTPRGIDALVNEQVQRWILAQRQRQAQRDAEHRWPVVTVSREFGSLGAAIANRAAERLGFQLWDQEVVHEIAGQTGASAKLVASLDERARGALEDLIAGSLFGAHGTSDEYMRQLASVLHTIGRHGSAVIVGRGAQWVLAPAETLRVRVICPFEQRVEGYAQREGLGRREAEQKIQQVEEDRRTFFRQRYGRDVTDPAYYDLMVNSGTFAVDDATSLVVHGYRTKFGRLPPAVG